MPKPKEPLYFILILALATAILAQNNRENIIPQQTKEKLDHFLTKFSTSSFAPTFFHLRLEYCRKIAERNLEQGIVEYDEFLQKYPDRFLSIIGLQECFELYEKIETVDYWRQFLKKYNHSIYKIVAEEHIKSLIFREAQKINSIESYESFIEKYPSDILYREKCIQLANAKAAADEQNWRDRQNNDNVVFRRIQGFKVKVKRKMDDYRNISDINLRTENYLADLEIQRVIYLFEHVYSLETVDFVIAWEQFKDIIGINKQLQKIIEQQQEKVLKIMQEQFAVLNKNMAENFELLRTDVSKLQENVLHFQKETNLRFEQVQTQIEQLQHDLTHLRTDFKGNTEQIAVKLNGISQELKCINRNIVAALPQKKLSDDILDSGLGDIAKAIFGEDKVRRVVFFYTGCQKIVQKLVFDQ